MDAENHNLSQANYVCLSTSAPSSILPPNTWIGIVDTAMSQQTHIVMWGTLQKNKAGCETETEL